MARTTLRGHLSYAALLVATVSQMRTFKRFRIAFTRAANLSRFASFPFM